MKKDGGVSVEAVRALNALIDGQLPADEAERLERRLQSDPTLQRRLRELRGVRALVRQAFDDTRSRRARREQRRHSAVAAAVALLAGMALGWGLHARVPSPSGGMAAGDTYVLQPAHLAKATPASEGKVLLHIGSSDLDRAQAALQRAEQLLAQSAQEGKRLSFEVVVNSTGLDLLRADASPIGERVRQLQQRYSDLTFIVCRQTVERWKQERGGDPALLPGVVVGPPALEHIIDRLEQGWIFLRA